MGVTLYLHAALVVVAALAVGAYWLLVVFGKPPRRFFFAWLMVLPGSFIVNPFFKQPVGSLLGLSALIENEGILPKIIGVVAANSLAPVFEETYKLLPVLVFRFLGKIHGRREYLIAGLFSGFGFGLGEAWYLAGVVPNMESFEGGHHFIYYSGFFFERLVVVVLHAMMTAIAAHGLFAQRAGRAIMVAMGLHYVLNLGAALYVLGFIDGNLAYVPICLSMILVFQKFKVIERQYMAENFTG